MKSQRQRRNRLYYCLGFILGLVFMIQAPFSLVYLSASDKEHAFATTEEARQQRVNEIIEWYQTHSESVESFVRYLPFYIKYEMIYYDGITKQLYGILRDDSDKVDIVASKYLKDMLREHHQRIDFEGTNDTVVFHLVYQGLMYRYKQYGLYYSPEDKPLWVDTVQTIAPESPIGQCLCRPMKRCGLGWEADMDALNHTDKELLSGYHIYTEKIDDNVFYFETWY